METKVLVPIKENIEYVANLLRQGEVCGIPTETVYGLAANAYDEKAVEKIFKAKGRPQDNPLIVHISSLDMLKEVVEFVPQVAYDLAEKFWPGPLTMIFKKSDKISTVVTAGLDTVAVRFPSHKIANTLIKTANIPLAAPSANISGSPSPTTANHVFTDLNGKVPAILDGGACEYGLESTVILLKENSVRLLRPGAVTIEDLKTVVENVEVDKGVLEKVDENEVCASPGMKHKHYSPQANIVIIDSDFESFKEFLQKHSNENIGAMVFDGEDSEIDIPCVTYGDIDDSTIQAKLLFSSLRCLDDLKVDKIYARMPDKTGIGLGVYNRLIRAAGFEVIKL